MWNYEKRLEYPVNITTPNPKIAQVILTQFGGPDGELSASMRYLAQRYTMPYRNIAGLLTDIGTEASKMHPPAGFSAARQTAKSPMLLQVFAKIKHQFPVFPL